MVAPLTAELSSTAGDAAAIIESTASLVTAALEPTEFDQIPDLVSVVIPDGWSRQTLDLEQWAEFPRRRRSHVRLQTTASLAQYINAQRTDGTLCYADGEDLTIVAVLNDHAPGGDPDMPGHRDHRATLTLEQTPGCERWLNVHGKYMDQETFAQLIEDGLTEIASPSGADLLELAQTIHATNNATFRSGIRLTSGQVQFQYVEQLDATAGSSGDMAIPEKITLVFEPFFGAEPVQIDARLRYRLNGGKLTLGVWLIRHVEALRTAFATECAALHDLTGVSGLDGVIALQGTPGD